METILVLDAACSAADLEALPAASGDRVVLFPLALRPRLLAECREALERRGCRVETAPSAGLVDEAAVRLRPAYLAWVAGLPEAAAAGGPDLRTLFAADEHSSLWWAGLVAEKNPFKSDAFNALSQLAAVAACIQKGGVRHLSCGLGHSRLRLALRRLAADRGLGFSCLCPGLLRRFWESCAGTGGARLARGVLAAAVYAARTCRRGLRLAGGRPAPGAGRPALIVAAYWPFLDREAARRGVFRHRHAGVLQEAIEAEGWDLEWCLVSVPEAALSPCEESALVRGLRAGGARLHFPEAGLGPAALLRCAWRWLRCSWRFLRAEAAIARAHRLEDLDFYELFRDDWFASFAGKTGCAGLLYYEGFRALLRGQTAEACLYYCEMLAWEKALLSAAQAEGRPARMLGYQSGTVSPMLLSYFHAPGEAAGVGPYPMPRPGRILCNGEVNRLLLSRSCWSAAELGVVEAIRYNHLKRRLAQPVPEKEDLVLVALSISPAESGAVLAAVNEALSGLPGMKVYVRSHPGLPLVWARERAGLASGAEVFPEAAGPLEGWLERARIVVGGETGVVIEALAFSCQVICLQTPEHFSLSPLRGRDLPGVHWVSSVAELREAAVSGLRGQPAGAGATEVVREFFHLDDETDVPRRLMCQLREAVSGGGRDG